MNCTLLNLGVKEVVTCLSGKIAQHYYLILLILNTIFILGSILVTMFFSSFLTAIITAVIVYAIMRRRNYSKKSPPTTTNNTLPTLWYDVSVVDNPGKDRIELQPNTAYGDIQYCLILVASISV